MLLKHKFNKIFNSNSHWFSSSSTVSTFLLSCKHAMPLFLISFCYPFSVLLIPRASWMLLLLFYCKGCFLVQLQRFKYPWNYFNCNIPFYLDRKEQSTNSKNVGSHLYFMSKRSEKVAEKMESTRVKSFR